MLRSHWGHRALCLILNSCFSWIYNVNQYFSLKKKKTTTWFWKVISLSRRSGTAASWQLSGIFWSQNVPAEVQMWIWFLCQGEEKTGRLTSDRICRKMLNRIRLFFPLSQITFTSKRENLLNSINKKNTAEISGTIEVKQQFFRSDRSLLK